jgi:hypothetical protein
VRLGSDHITFNSARISLGLLSYRPTTLGEEAQLCMETSYRALV